MHMINDGVEWVAITLHNRAQLIQPIHLRIKEAPCWGIEGWDTQHILDQSCDIKTPNKSDRAG